MVWLGGLDTPLGGGAQRAIGGLEAKGVSQLILKGLSGSGTPPGRKAGLGRECQVAEKRGDESGRWSFRGHNRVGRRWTGLGRGG